MQVLKNHGLFGLNEAQLRILLLQNDPCLLPEVSHRGVTLMSHSLQVLSPFTFLLALDILIALKQHDSVSHALKVPFIIAIMAK